MKHPSYRDWQLDHGTSAGEVMIVKHPRYKDRQLDHGTSAGEVMIVKHQRYKDRQLDHGTFAGGSWLVVAASQVTERRMTSQCVIELLMQTPSTGL